jgi:hypothetical protein
MPGHRWQDPVTEGHRWRGLQVSGHRSQGPLAGQPGAGQAGSISVELVVLAPALLLLLLLLAAGARVVEVQGQVDGAARDAARAASVARSAAQAAGFAQQAAQADLNAASWCLPHTVQAQVSGFSQASTLPAGGAGVADVRVAVSCEVSMSPFRLLGFSPARRFSGQAVAPLDPFMCRDGTC